MRPTILLLLAIVISLAPSLVSAQRIYYSEVERDDYRQVNFDIIGKVSGNILIYKNFRAKNDLCIYDYTMKLKDRIDLDFLPDKVINIDFISYPDFVYGIYQFQKRNIIYCLGVKLDGDGKKLSDPIEIDTTHINTYGDNKIYSTIFSEDRQKIMVFKINKRNDKNYIFTTLLLDPKLQLQKKSRIGLSSDDKDAVFSDFVLDNEGDMVFAHCARSGSRDYITGLNLLIKHVQSDSFNTYKFNIGDKLLDEVKIKADNVNEDYLINSFYYKQKRGNIEGLYTVKWNKVTNKIDNEKYTVFTDELKTDAKPESGSAKMAFNDYFIRQIIPKKDGGFIVVSESYYTSSRYNPWNRYDYLYNPSYYSPFDYYYWSPYGYNYWNPWNRWNSNQSTRYYSDNISVFSFNGQVDLEWSNIVRKSQYDDDTDNFLSYLVYNSGSEISFLYNQVERRSLLLNQQSLSPDGKINRTPTLKNLDKGYEFMPKYGKQIGAKQLIIPCMYRNYISFAIVDF
jgi:hypothetical protein